MEWAKLDSITKRKTDRKRYYKEYLDKVLQKGLINIKVSNEDKKEVTIYTPETIEELTSFSLKQIASGFPGYHRLVYTALTALGYQTKKEEATQHFLTPQGALGCKSVVTFKSPPSSTKEIAEVTCKSCQRNLKKVNLKPQEKEFLDAIFEVPVGDKGPMLTKKFLKLLKKDHLFQVIHTEEGTLLKANNGVEYVLR